MWTSVGNLRRQFCFSGHSETAAKPTADAKSFETASSQDACLSLCSRGVPDGLHSFQSVSRRELQPSAHVQRPEVPHTKLLDLPRDVLQRIIDFLPTPGHSLHGVLLKEAREMYAVAETCTRLFNIAQDTLVKIHALDALSPSSLEGPRACLPHYSSPGYLSFMVSLAAPALLSLHLPRFPGIEGDKAVLRKAAKCCAKLLEVTFSDGGAVDGELAEELLKANQSLEFCEIYKPGVPILNAMADADCPLRVAVFTKIPKASLVALERFVENKREQLRTLQVEFDPLDDCNYAIMHFLGSLQELAGKPNVSLRCLVLTCEPKSYWAMRYLRRLKQELHKNFMMEMEVSGQTFIIRESVHHEHELYRRIIYHKEYHPQGPYAVVDESAGEDFRLSTFDVGEALKWAPRPNSEVTNEERIIFDNHDNVRRMQARFPLHTWDEVLQTFSIAAPLLWNGCSIVTLEISREVVLFSSAHADELEDLLRWFEGVNVLHLNAPENYQKEGGKKARPATGLFLMQLPTFVKILQRAKPNLQTLYMEDAGDLYIKRAGWPWLRDAGRMRELLLSALLCLDDYEKTSSVDAGTVRAQLETWLSKPLKIETDLDCVDTGETGERQC